jgi:hypothetical protein
MLRSKKTMSKSRAPIIAAYLLRKDQKRERKKAVDCEAIDLETRLAHQP